MDLPGIPVRLAATTAFLDELIVYEVPGILFLMIWGSAGEGWVLPFLSSKVLGYTTRIFLLAVAAFVIGVGLQALGEILVGVVVKGIIALDRRVAFVRPWFRTR